MEYEKETKEGKQPCLREGHGLRDKERTEKSRWWWRRKERLEEWREGGKKMNQRCRENSAQMEERRRG